MLILSGPATAAAAAVAVPAAPAAAQTPAATSSTTPSSPAAATTQAPAAPSASAGPGSPVSAAPTTPPTTTIRSQQDQVVTAAHIVPLDTARLAVARYTADTGRDERAVAADRTASTGAGLALSAAVARLAVERTALATDQAELAAERRTLALDQDRLRALAIGMYTGALTNPQPAGPEDLQADTEQIIDTDEADIVAGQVDSHLRRDQATVASDVKQVGRAVAGVEAGQRAITVATATVNAVAKRSKTDQANLVSDRKQLALANLGLDTAEAALAAALDSVRGPSSAPSGQLTLLGGAALNARQLVAWYESQGYVDLTAAPIQDLAAWYIEAGAEEGVRGDVAFAQAVLETGGFSSPDAVDLSNFAGIGHCDTCAAGWAFPSPQLGVLGQVQLLRIFADKGPGPAHAPPPVLPVLIPARQGQAGCCSTVESLTGIWATDPTYGQQILEIYASMLASALSPA